MPVSMPTGQWRGWPSPAGASATFSLGLLRELGSQRLLHRFDYLSTVSGGSYIGAYYAGLFAKRKGAEPLLGADAFKP